LQLGQLAVGFVAHIDEPLTCLCHDANGVEPVILDAPDAIDWLLAFAAEEDHLADDRRATAEHEPDPTERERAQEEATQREHTAAAAREDGAALYDSAERRASTAGDLESKGIDQETVATRMRADVSQAKPAAEAVNGATRGKAAKARKNRSRAAQVHHTSLDR
jgi:hypothetical protein